MAFTWRPPNLSSAAPRGHGEMQSIFCGEGFTVNSRGLKSICGGGGGGGALTLDLKAARESQNLQTCL